MRCLEKDPWERFSTAKELDDALQAVTFRSTRELTTPAETSGGLRGTLVALIAAAALLIGVLLGRVIG